MKNYFSSIRVPEGKDSDNGLSIALSELLDQLRITVNNLDLDNFSDAAKSIISTSKIHIKSENEVASGNIGRVNVGDIVAVCEPFSPTLQKITAVYIVGGRR